MIAKPTFHHLARGTASGRLTVTRIRDGIVLWQGDDAHQGAITDLAWSSDGQFLASAGEDGVVHVWLATSGDLLQSFTHGERVTRLRWSRQGMLASISDVSIRLWQLASATLAAAA